MAFIDEIIIHAEAGRGGDGVVRWRHEKFIPKGGPAGGDGGRGGDFYVRAVRDINALARYQAKREFSAGRGEDGKGKSLHGKKGEDFFLELPVGSVITNLGTEEKRQLLSEGETIQLLRGGYGGYGNEHFKGPDNTTPREWNPGQEGEKGDFFIELELFADIGLVGLPSAGKSSLLNALTKSRAKVGDYAFTTLDPNLGDFYGYVIADIPGLIKGANEGKGLGVKFLRHIKRTKMLAHLVSFENPDMLKAYGEVRKELEKYDQKLDLAENGLARKKEVVILSKTDMAENEKAVKNAVKEFKNLRPDVFIISLYDDHSVKELSSILSAILKNS